MAAPIQERYDKLAAAAWSNIDKATPTLSKKNQGKLNVVFRERYHIDNDPVPHADPKSIIIEPIGSGSNGSVYKDPALNVAIKVVKFPCARLFQAARARIQRAGAEDHFVRVFSVYEGPPEDAHKRARGEASNHTVFVMELLQADYFTLSQDSAVDLAPLATFLRFCEASCDNPNLTRPLTDLKPENIGLRVTTHTEGWMMWRTTTEKHKAVLCDFDGMIGVTYPSNLDTPRPLTHPATAVFTSDMNEVRQRRDVLKLQTLLGVAITAMHAIALRKNWTEMQNPLWMVMNTPNGLEPASNKRVTTYAALRKLPFASAGVLRPKERETQMLPARVNAALIRLKKQRESLGLDATLGELYSISVDTLAQVKAMLKTVKHLAANYKFTVAFCDA